MIASSQPRRPPRQSRQVFTPDATSRATTQEYTIIGKNPTISVVVAVSIGLALGWFIKRKLG